MGLKERGHEKIRCKETRKRRAIMFIGTEGHNKTETLYFSEYCKLQEIYSIQFTPGNYTDIDNISRCMLNTMKDMEFDSSKGDVAFCVIDLDVDYQKSQLIQSKINRLSLEGVECIISNPCFEVWFLCHFAFSTRSFIDSNEVIKQIKQYIPDYSKSTSVLPIIERNCAQAITNAKRIEEYHKQQCRNRCCIDTNPATEVYKVVSLLIQKA